MLRITMLYSNRPLLGVIVSVHIKRLSVLAGTVLLLLTVPLNQALATPPSASGASSTHCVLAAGGTQKPACFPSASAALRYASGGRIKASSVSAGYAELKGKINQSNQAAAAVPNSTLATVIIAVQCTDQKFGGSCLNFTDSTVCPGHPTKVWPNFQSPWNNNFDSGQLYAGCAGTGYDSPTIGGMGGYLNFACEGRFDYYLGFKDYESSFRAFNGGC